MTFKNFWRKRNEKFLKTFLTIVFLTLGFWTLYSLKTEATTTIEFANPSEFEDFMDLVDAIAKFFFYLAMPLATMMIVIAAFLLLTAGGDPKKVEMAKTLILYALIGSLLIILARAISSVITSAL